MKESANGLCVIGEMNVPSPVNVEEKPLESDGDDKNLLPC
jgi:hypothetical protein